MSRRKSRRGNPEDQITLSKVGAHHVGCVGDDGGEVSDGGDVEDSYDLPCNLSIHWNVTNASNFTSTSAATNNICLVIVADFDFLLEVFVYSISHISLLFLLYTWASSSHYVSVLLNIRQLNKLDLCQNFNCTS